jgi:hypothetical protein
VNHVLSEIERISVVQARELLHGGYEQQAFTSIVLGLEWFGSLVDGKPLGSKNQSRKRFELALGYFPADYLLVHKKINLYRQLRNRAIHNPWSDSKYLTFITDPSDHCKFENGTTSFSMLQFLNDFRKVIGEYKAKTQQMN